MPQTAIARRSTQRYITVSIYQTVRTMRTQTSLHEMKH